MTIEYTDELATRICALISEGVSVNQICARDEFPSRSTVLRWLDKYPTFEAKCARARSLQADQDFERTKEVVDKVEMGLLPPDVARVMLSGLQWRASKLNRARYGDKYAVVGGDEDDPAIKFQQMKESAEAELANIGGDKLAAISQILLQKDDEE